MRSYGYNGSITIGKSDPYIVMVSTPNQPGGLMYSIENEPKDKCIYKRLKLTYEVEVGKIYSEEEIEKVRHSPSFDRVYAAFISGRKGMSSLHHKLKRWN